GLAERGDRELAAVRRADFAARGPAVLLRHLRALAAYRPEPLASPPPTVVLWGEHDRGVPLADHAELALRCRGLLVPIAGAGHAPAPDRLAGRAGPAGHQRAASARATCAPIRSASSGHSSRGRSWPMPSRTTSSAPGMAAAVARPPLTSMSGSPAPWITSVRT